MSTAINKTVTIRDEDPELVEAVEVEEDLAPEKSIDEIKEAGGDPRDAIANKHAEKHRSYDKSDEKPDEIEQNIEKTTDNIDKTTNEELVSIKVGGKILQVEKSRVDKAGGVQAYQKEVAVNQGFQDIAARKKELDEQAEAIARKEQELADKEKTLSQPRDEPKPDSDTANPDLPDKGDHTVSDLIKQHREALLDGDDELADKAMAQLFSIRDSGNKPDTNVDELETRAAQKAVEEIDRRDYVKTVLGARQTLYSNHPELKTDKRLFEHVDIETDTVRKEWTNDPKKAEFTVDEIFEEAYRRVTGLKKDPETETTTLDGRLEEKRSIQRPRSGTGRSQPEPPPRNDTRSEYVQNLRKQRGLDQ